MKKILILANNDVGLYRFRKELIERLIDEGNEVFISLPEGRFIKYLKKLGAQYIKTSLNRHGTNPIQDIKLFFKYLKIIYDVKPDIVFTYTIKPNIYGGLACCLTNTPYVVNITGLGTAVEKKGILQKLTLLFYKVVLAKAQTVFFQNKENKQFFESYQIAVDKHKMLPGSGVNLKNFIALEYPKEDMLKFAFVSRIMKEKGIEQYLEMAEAVHSKYPNTEFHICGFCEEKYEGKLKEYVDRGIVIYHGLVDNIQSIYEQVHCVIHPTYYPEGLSNVLLEASASARPVITTNRSGCREVVDEGVNGFIIHEKSSKDLIEKVEVFINIPWIQKKHMGIQGRIKVENEFNREIVIQNYINETRGI